MSTPKNVCPECFNEPSILFKCYKCDKLYCEQCTLKQKREVSQGKIEVKYYCPKCNSELNETINLSKYIKSKS